MMVNYAFQTPLEDIEHPWLIDECLYNRLYTCNTSLALSPSYHFLGSWTVTLPPLALQVKFHCQEIAIKSAVHL